MEQNKCDNYVLVYNKFETTGTEVVKEYFPSFNLLEDRIGSLFTEARVGFLFSGQIQREITVQGNNITLKQNV